MQQPAILRQCWHVPDKRRPFCRTKEFHSAFYRMRRIERSLPMPLTEPLWCFITDGFIEHKRNVFEGEKELLEASRLAVLTDNPAMSIKSHIFAANTPSDDVAILTVTFKQSDTSSGITSIGALHFNRLEIENTGDCGQRRIEDFDGEADVSNHAPAKIQ